LAWGEDLALWHHQAEALATIRAYTSGASADRAALIRMPTGTGKTGVMAVACREIIPNGDVLVLSPWDALVEQLRADLGERFWSRIECQAPGFNIRRLLPSTAAQSLADAHPPTLWIGTIAALRAIAAHDADSYSQLAGQLQTVFVDEGHYEPARAWSDAVRGLGRPTVLLTATPYRNDFKFFSVDPAHVFQYGHAAAEASGQLRHLRLQAVEFTSPETFCDSLLQVVHNRLPASARVIVRCATQSSVQAITQELAARDQAVVGIHENFDPAVDQRLKRRVPDPSVESARFWVHQFKLTEGIDDHRFRMVAFYEPFGNHRALVQQVGRVLRNPAGQQVPAWVVHRSGDGVDLGWTAYRSYDEAALATGLQFDLAGIAATMPTQYLDRRFRTAFDLHAVDVHEALRYPMTTTVWRCPPTFDLDQLAANVESAMEDSDRLTSGRRIPDVGIYIYVFIAVRNSPLLETEAFLEPSVGVCVVARVGNLVFFHDSHGLRPSGLGELEPVSTSELLRTYPTLGSDVTAVTLVNTDLGASAIRRRRIETRTLQDSPPDLSDATQLPTSTAARVRIDDGGGGIRVVRRHVGLSTGRIRDEGRCDLEALIAWMGAVEATIENAAGGSGPMVFKRFAQAVKLPADTTPGNILLDVPSGVFEVQVDGHPAPLDFEDVCMDVNAGSFSWQVNGETFDVTVAWDGSRNGYRLECDELNQRSTMVTQVGDQQAMPLISYLNRWQSFRILPVPSADGSLLYVGGRFCQATLPIGQASDEAVDLSALLTPVTALATTRTEKGAPGSATPQGWEPGSVFGRIDSQGAGTELAAYLDDVDILVCDDLGIEVADFLACDPVHGRVAAIHAKASDTVKPLSASGLHDVTGQALKNLAYLQPHRVADPPGVAGKWSQPWSDGITGMVSNRIRVGTGTPADTWALVRQRMRDPSMSREVWLVLGQMLSKSALDAARVSATPPGHVVQLLYSLQSTWAAVASAGCRLRVFCSP
jgi:hypothetical protein